MTDFKNKAKLENVTNGKYSMGHEKVTRVRSIA